MRICILIQLFFIFSSFNLNLFSYATSKVTKIVAIHSYSKDFPWTHMILDSYKNELNSNKINFEVINFYFDVKKVPFDITKVHPLMNEITKTLKQKKPDIIFLTDDFAFHQMSQLLIELKIPFVFAGINGEIPSTILQSNFKKYSGVFERYYVSDSVHLLERLLNKNKLNLLVLLEKSETSDEVEKYIKNEFKKYPGLHYEILKTSDFDIWKSSINNSKKKFDALYPLQPYALKDSNGSYLKPAMVIEWIYNNSLIPTIYTAEWHIKCGGTLAIGLRPKAQGQFGAKLTLDLLQNKITKPLIPPQGDIVINYVTTEKLKIKIPFDILTTAKIVKSVSSPCNPD